MPAPGPGTRAFSSTLALCLALIGAASFLFYHQALFVPRAEAARSSRGVAGAYSFGNDFYQVWLSCRELLRNHRDPYSREMTQEIQEGLYGRLLDRNLTGDPIDQRAFPYPAYTDLLLLPTAALPFETVRILVLCALLTLSIASVPIWLQALGWTLNWKWLAVAVLLTLCSYPALEGLFAGQLGLLVAFLLAASVLSLQRGRFLLAGVLLALTTMKPQVTGLAIFYLLLWSLHQWRARRALLIGFFSTMLLLLATSLAVLPNWIQSWTHTVLAYRHYPPPPLVTEVLTSPLGPRFSGPASLVLIALSLLIAIILSWRNRAADPHSFKFWLTLTTLLAITTITILQGLAVYDHLILIPAILLLFRRRNIALGTTRIPRVLAVVGILILLWPWMSAFALIALRPFFAASTFNSTAIFSLPVRTAASLPFVVLALLAFLWKFSLESNSELA